MKILKILIFKHYLKLLSDLYDFMIIIKSIIIKIFIIIKIIYIFFIKNFLFLNHNKVLLYSFDAGQQVPVSTFQLKFLQH